MIEHIIFILVAIGLLHGAGLFVALLRLRDLNPLIRSRAHAGAAAQ